jgi:hypothetical protein
MSGDMKQTLEAIQSRQRLMQASDRIERRPGCSRTPLGNRELSAQSPGEVVRPIPWNLSR